MKKNIFITLFIMITSFLSCSNFEPTLILNAPNERNLPRNFRTSRTVFPEISDLPTRKGLNELNILGSGQFSEASFLSVMEEVGHPSDLVVVDLREECHGFINGQGVSLYGFRDWTNIGKTKEAIVKEEREFLDGLPKEAVIIGKIINKRSKEDLYPELDFLPPVKIEKAETEEELIHRLGYEYIRIPLTDHIRPSDYSVDRFVEFIRELPPKKHLYFHCAAGVGRTSIFMLMFDMMKNARNVSFEDITKRQMLIGGKEFLVLSEKPWKKKISQDKIDFLKSFYDYCRSNEDNFKTYWSHYLIHQKTT